MPRVLFRALAFGTIWVLLTGAAAGSFVIGGLVVGAAVVTSMAFRTPGTGRMQVGGLARFVPYFLWHSIHGGVDVAFRALHPGLPLEPSVGRLPLRLQAGGRRTLFIGVVSLLPGTLSMELSGDELVVHLVGRRDRAFERLRELEEKIAGIFGERLADTETSDG